MLRALTSRRHLLAGLGVAPLAPLLELMFTAGARAAAAAASFAGGSSSAFIAFLGDLARRGAPGQLAVPSLSLGSDASLDLAGGSLTLAGQGPGRSVLDFGGQARGDAYFLRLSQDCALELANLEFRGGGRAIYIPTEDFTRPDGSAKVKSITLSNVAFRDVEAAVSMMNDHRGANALARVGAISVTDCEVDGARRGIIFGDLGRYFFETAVFRNLKITRAGRFGLFIGTTDDQAQAQVKSIVLENIEVNDLVYEAGTNCAPIYVAGQHVRLSNIRVTGALAPDPATLRQSDKEGIYLKCIDAELDDIHIRDVLGNQAGMMFKGRPEDAPDSVPRGRDCRMRNFTITQTPAALGQMNGIWCQIDNLTLENGVLEGLGANGFELSTHGLSNATVRDLTVRNHLGGCAVLFASSGGGNFLAERVSVEKIARDKNEFRAFRIEIKTGKRPALGPLKTVTVKDCRIDPGAGGSCRTIGVAVSNTRAAPLQDVSITGCHFAADCGVLVQARGPIVNLRIAGCDFTGVPDPTLAISAAAPKAKPKGRGGRDEDEDDEDMAGFSPGRAAPVIIEPDNKGIVTAASGTAAFAAGQDSVMLRHGLTQLAGFDATPAPGDIALSDAGLTVTATSPAGFTVGRRDAAAAGAFGWKLTKRLWQPLATAG